MNWEEHHECPERSEGCEGSQTKSQSDTHKPRPERSDGERQRHGRHGCDEGVLMPLDEKLFRLRKSSRRSCRDWSLRDEATWCVDWRDKRSAMRRSDLESHTSKIIFDVIMNQHTKCYCKKFYDVVTSHRTRNAIRFKFVTSITDRSDQKNFLIIELNASASWCIDHDHRSDPDRGTRLGSVSQ